MATTRHLFLLFTLLLFTGLSINAHAGPVCDDGVIEGDETCEPANSLCRNSGNNVGEELCRADVCTCCGDGIVDGDYNEECDDRNNDNLDGCDTEGVNTGGNGACTLTFCGDGAVQPNGNGDGVNEQCDPPGTAICDTNCQTIETCSDGITNQDETDVDCGGSICDACTNGYACLVDGDCISNSCVGNVCTAITTTVPTTTTTVPTTTTTVPTTTTTTTEVTTTTTVPPGGGDIVIGDCDTGVEDSGGIQEGIDQCAADAGNHGQFVRCVAIFTRGLVKDDVISNSDRRPIMKCASHSSNGNSGAASSSSSKAVKTEPVKAAPVKAAPVISARSARADRRERLRERIAEFRAKYYGR